MQKNSRASHRLTMRGKNNVRCDYHRLGCVGTATAYELSKYQLNTLVLEAGIDVVLEQLEQTVQSCMLVMILNRIL